MAAVVIADHAVSELREEQKTMCDFKIVKMGRGFSVMVKTQDGWRQLVSGFRSAAVAVDFLLAYKPARAIR